MKKCIITIICILIAVLIAFAVCKYTVLTPFLFENSELIDQDANRQIKKIITEAIKNNHSYLASQNENPENESHEKGLFTIINDDFMKSLTKTEDGNYSVKVKLTSPDDWQYYFYIRESGGEYSLLYYEIDP